MLYSRYIDWVLPIEFHFGCSANGLDVLPAFDVYELAAEVDESFLSIVAVGRA
jgi:hypothetical protein